MNLSKLFPTQAKLDERIVQEHGLEGQDLLDKKILALQVELGELANEWRGFKFWKVNPIPRVKATRICRRCGGSGTPHGIPVESGVDCWECDDSTGEIEYNPLLEEYVDCVHFFISIALDMGIQPHELYVYDEEIEGSISEIFIELFYCIGRMYFVFDKKYQLRMCFHIFINFGIQRLGFTWEQIEQAYLDKNKINHARQNTGY